MILGHLTREIEGKQCAVALLATAHLTLILSGTFFEHGATPGQNMETCYNTVSFLIK